MTKVKMGNHKEVSLKSGTYQSIAGYAEERGISTVAVLNQIKLGKVEAVRIGRAWIIKTDIPM